MSGRGNNFGFDDSDLGFEDRPPSQQRRQQTRSSTVANNNTASPNNGDESPPEEEPGSAKPASSADWILSCLIAFFYPLLVLKLSQAFWPITDCSNADPTAVTKCENEGVTRGNWQYIFSIFAGILGLLLSLVLIRMHQTSRAAALGMAYGGLFTLLAAVVSNQHKFTPLTQALIIGALLVMFIFLPRISGGLLFKNDDKALKKTD